MKSICIAKPGIVELRDVPKPERAQPGYLIIKMKACGINAGDLAFINGVFPPGFVPESLHNMAGVSGVGTVVETGAGVPDSYKNRNVAVYRSLRFGDEIIGTWCEYAHLHYLQCVLLPSEVNVEDYAASLVNIITPYAFLKHIEKEGHKSIISTAGSSATGIALIGICLQKNFPLISLVRTEADKKELETLGAPNVLAQSDINFRERLKELALELHATAIFDGVGGSILNNIIDVIPSGSTIWCYGYLGGKESLTIHTSVLMRDLTLKGFSNFRSDTVHDADNLSKALTEISGFVGLPHFKTKIGERFGLEDIHRALSYKSDRGKRAVLSL